MENSASLLPALGSRPPPIALPRFTFHLPPSTSLSTNYYFLSPVKLNTAAFSLTEVVVALGIFAVSMVGILALFPVASSTGRESSEETQAAILAQTIWADLRVSSLALGGTNSWIISGPDTFGQITRGLTFRQTNDSVVAYDVRLRNLSGTNEGTRQIGPPIALKALTNASYSNYVSGLTNLSAARYLAWVQIRPHTNILGLATVRIEISLPPDQNLTNRRVYAFTTQAFAP